MIVGFQICISRQSAGSARVWFPRKKRETGSEEERERRGKITESEGTASRSRRHETKDERKKRCDSRPAREGTHAGARL